MGFRVLGVGERVCALERTALKDSAAEHGMPAGDPLLIRAAQGDRTEMRTRGELVTDQERQDRVLAAAESDRVADDRVEDRLLLGRRRRDDLEDLAERRLSFERLLRFVEQAHVLDRDDRLIRE